MRGDNFEKLGIYSLITLSLCNTIFVYSIIFANTHSSIDIYIKTIFPSELLKVKSVTSLTDTSISGLS